MRKWCVVPLVALLCMGLASVSMADVPDTLDLDAIRSQQAEIRVGANAATGVYQDMSEATRRDLLSRQDRVLRVIEGKSSAEQLSKDQRMAVFNDLEWIESAINNAEDERMVCERRKKIGSNRVERVCMTARQQREMRDAAQQEMSRGGDRNMRVGD